MTAILAWTEQNFLQNVWYKKFKFFYYRVRQCETQNKSIFAILEYTEIIKS